MNLSVSLSGLSVPWRLTGTAELSAWLNSRPWMREGGVRALKVAPSALDMVRSALWREVHAAHQGRGHVQGVELPPEDVAAGPAIALGRLLGLDEEASDRDMANLVGQQVAIEPMVCLAQAFQVPAVTGLVDRYGRFVEMIGKLGHDRSPVVLVLHDSPDATGPGTLRLDRGQPLDAPKLVLDRSIPESNAWLLYVHLRLAWETGGDVEVALALDASQPSSLRPGDEDGLEIILSRHAADLAGRLSPDELSKWLQYMEALLGSYAAGRPKIRRQPRPDALSSEAGLAPPWLARALITMRPNVAMQPLLRSLIICRPLSEQILSRTFALEALIRSQLPTPPDRDAPDIARFQFERFSRDPGQLVRRLYPISHPLPPDSPWDFASLGEITTALRSMDLRVADHVDRLRTLRNAIAHNHYAGWEAVKQLRELEFAIASQG